MAQKKAPAGAEAFGSIKGNDYLTIISLVTLLPRLTM